MGSLSVPKHSVQDYIVSKQIQGHSGEDISKHLDLVGYSSHDYSEKLVEKNLNSSKPITHKKVQIKPHMEKSKTTLLKLISYLQLSITKKIPKLTIYAHLIKHGWDKPLIEKAYGIAVGAIKDHSSNQSVALKKDTKFLLSQIDELSAKVSLKKAKITLSRNELKKQKSKQYSHKLHSKYTKSHFFTKAKQKASRKDMKQKLKPQKIKESDVHSDQLKKIEAELAMLDCKIARNEGIVRSVAPPFAQVQPQMIPQQIIPQQVQAPPLIISAGDKPTVAPTASVQTEQSPTKVKNSPTESTGPTQSAPATQSVNINPAQMEQIKDVSSQSSSYTRPQMETPLTINASSINVINKEGTFATAGNAGPSAAVHNHYHDEGGELGLFNPIVEKDLEFSETPVGDRVPTGIPDLDGVISGGLNAKSTTLVSGGAGSGKSTFGLQYLVNGIIKNNEPGIYITFEQTREAVISLGQQFGWDLEHLVAEGMLIIHEYTPEQIAKALQAGGGSIRDMVDSIKAKRIVLDSITEYKMLFRSEIDQRKELTALFKSFSKWGCTTVIVGQEHSDSHSHMSSVLDYESDAVILLYNERRGDIRQRSLEIYKMRDTKHAGRIFPMELSNNGMVVHTKQVKLVAGRR